MGGSSRNCPPTFIWLMVFSCFSLRLDGVFGQDCNSVDWSDSDRDNGYINQDPINGQYIGFIKEFSMTNTIRIDSTSISNMNKKFIDATFNNNTMRIEATNEMRFYEEEQIEPEITLTIELFCANGAFRTFYFQQKIDPRNNHDPVFQQSEYKILVPLPLPRGFFLNFLLEISARDIDIHNNRVTFSSLNDLSLFTVGTSPTIGSDSKTFYATVQTTNQLLRLPEPFVFTIIGTDSGEPTRRTGNATVIIEADANIEYVEVPRFEQPFYRGSLNSDLTLNVPQPVLSLETYSSDIEFKLIDGDSAWFRLTKAANVITVALATQLTQADIKNRSVLLTTLVANVSNVGHGSTVILVDLPPPVDAPTFEKTSYQGRITRDNELIYESPVVVLETFDDEVVFELQGNDSAIFVLTSTSNTVLIGLIPNALPTLFGKSFLITQIVATKSNGDSGTTEFIVTLPSTIPPVFNSGITVGKIDLERNLTIPTISLSPDTYPVTNIYFELLNYGDSRLFQFNVANNVVTISLARELTDDDTMGRSYFSVGLRATNSVNSSGIAVIIVDIDQPAPIVLPTFSKPLYQGSLGYDRKLTNFETVLVNEHTFNPEVIFSLQNDYDYEMFHIENTLNSVNVSLARELTADDIEHRTHLVAILIAYYPEVDPVSSVLLINIPVPPSLPVFEQPIFRGSIDDNIGLTVEKIVLLDNTYTASIEFALHGDDSALFTHTVQRNVVTIALNESVTEDRLAGRDFLSFEVVAFNPESGSSGTAVLISLPDKCSVDSTPMFENKLYVFTIKSDTLGSLGKVFATVLSNSTAEIQYHLDPNDSLSSRVSINSSNGELTLGNVLELGSYTVAVFAVDASTLLEGRSNIKIDVEQVIVCQDSHGPSVENALEVKYLIENREHTEVMSSVIGNCSFQVIKMIPSNQVFVNINSETKQLTTIAMDRESDIFGDMDVPQIQVTLQLQCDSPTPNQTRLHSNQHTTYDIANDRFIAPQSSDSRFYVLTESIPFAVHTTILSIIIEDENDNVPQFVRPFTDNHLVGYPESLLAAIIMPPHLYQIQAIDRDSGINSQIHYSIADSAEFQINGETGVITPAFDALRNSGETTLTIRATDRNGATDGLTNTRQLRVKRIEERHISVITIQEEVLDEIENILDIIFEVVAIEFKVLHSAIIPGGEEKVEARDGGQVNVLRMFIYAFDSDDSLIDATVIEEKLKNFDAQVFKLEAATYASNYSDNSSLNNLTALVIGCCVLFALLLLSCLGTFLLWWFKVRPYDYLQMDETASVSSQLKLGAPATSLPQSYPVMKINRFEVEKRDSIDIRGSTLDSTEDNMWNSNLEHMDDVTTQSQTTNLESVNNTRKSNGVRFNEQVERIEILVDADTGPPNNINAIYDGVERL